MTTREKNQIKKAIKDALPLVTKVSVSYLTKYSTKQSIQLYHPYNGMREEYLAAKGTVKSMFPAYDVMISVS